MEKKNTPFSIRLSDEEEQTLLVEMHTRSKKAGVEISKIDVFREFIANLRECQIDTFSLMNEIYGSQVNKENKENR